MSYAYAPGLYHTPSFQSSGFPWITGSVIPGPTIKKFQFPFVTKSFLLANTGSGVVYLSFADPTTDPTVASGFHQFPISSSGSLTCNVKCADIWLSGSGIATSVGETGISIIGELTRINRDSYPILTGSGFSGFVDLV